MKATKIPAQTLDEARTWVVEFAQRHSGLGIFQVLHDDDCPAIKTGRDADCEAPCKPDFYLIQPFADARDN